MTNERPSLKNKMRLAVLTERIDVAGPEVAIFRLRPRVGELFAFKAGQYATLGLEVGERFIPRAYSIASTPYEREHLEFYINVIKQGELTPALFGLHIGDSVYYMGPKGLFTLERTSTKHLLFVATGTGLAPYVSMLRTLHAEQWAGHNHGRVITLVHGVRYTADLCYRWELHGLAREQAFNFTHIPMVSRPENDPFWTPDLGRGRVTELLSMLGNGQPASESPLGNELDPRAVVERLPPGDTAVFLCGNPDMIADAKAMLTERGYGEIYTEEYW